MDDSQKDAAAYCSDLVRRRDEDRWLAAQYAKGDDARKLLALYALQCELRRVPASVSEPPLGEIRLQWWRDALADIRDGRPHRKHPVVEEAARSGLADNAFADRFEMAISAAARPLYGEGFSDAEDVAGWTAGAEGVFDALAVQLLGGGDEFADAAARAGAAFAMAREGRGLAPSLASETAQAASSCWSETREALRAAPSSLAPALAHLSLTPLYLARGDRPFPVVKRLKLFSCIAFGRF